MKNITLSSNGSKGHHRFQLYVEESTTDNTNSYMYFNFQLSALQNGWDWSGWGSSINYSIMIGDNNFTGSIPSYDGRSTINLATRSNIKIPHNADGTKTINVSFSVSDGTGQRYTCGDASDSGSLELSRLHKPPLVTYKGIVEKNPLLLPQMANTIVNYLGKTEFKVDYTPYDGATITNIKLYDRTGMDYEGSAKTIITNANNGSITIDFSKHWFDTTFSSEIFIIEIIDSLGASSRVNTSKLTTIQYRRPSIVPTSSNIKRNGQLSGKVNLTLLASFYNAKINQTTNTFVLSYKYWKFNEAEPTTYYNIPNNEVTISNNNISLKNWNVKKNGAVITDVNNQFNYKFKIKIKDSFDKTAEIELICSKGVWLMCRFKDRVDFNKITIKGKSIIPETIYEGEIVGGDSISLPNTRRFLDIYAKIEFGEKNITMKYIIDTLKISDECYGSALMTPFDEPTLDTIYISEAQYNKSTKILTYTRTGFFNTGNGAYSDRSNNTSYVIYRVDTHD